MDWVIDVDAHVTEPSDVFADRLPARYRDQGPRLVRDERSGYDVWKVDGATIASVGHTATAGWPDRFPSSPKTMDDVPRAAWNAEARLEYLDEIGVWAQVMYPNVGGFGNQAFLKLKDADLQLACVRALQRLADRLVLGRPAPAARRHRDTVLGRRRVGCGDRALRRSRAPRRAVHRGAAALRPAVPRRPALGPALGRGAGRGAPGELPHRRAATSPAASHPGASRRTVRVRAYVSTSVSLFLTNGVADRRSAHLGCAAALPRPQVRLGRERDRVPAVRARGGRLRVRRVVDGDRPARVTRSRASSSAARCTAASSSRSSGSDA